jgi:hypothetical protein
MTEIKSFNSPGRSKDMIQFQIDEDIFNAVPSIGGVILREMLDQSVELASVVAEGVNNSNAAVLGRQAKEYSYKVVSFLDQVLTEESSQRFAERLRSVTEPIELNQVYAVYMWLLEQYSGRPTMPSSLSSNGHDGTGTSLTVGAPPEE